MKPPLSLSFRLAAFIVFVLFIPAMFGIVPFLFLWAQHGFVVTPDELIRTPNFLRTFLSSIILCGGFPVWAGFWLWWDMCVWLPPKIGMDQNPTDARKNTTGYASFFLFVLPVISIVLGAVLGFFPPDDLHQMEYAGHIRLASNVIMAITYVLSWGVFVVYVPRNEVDYQGDTIGGRR